jgi:uncharacterized SAM-binding protein YcdF (DUF218 family)
LNLLLDCCILDHHLNEPENDPMEAIAFSAKKMISLLFVPLNLSLLLIFIGIFLWRWTARSRTGFGMTLAGALLLLVMSLPVTASLLTGHLEAKAGGHRDPSELAAKGVHYIVVLSYTTVTDRATPADRWGKAILGVLEGIRLHRAVPNSVLVLSGGAYPGGQSEAEAMAELPHELGVVKENLILETSAWDTQDEARIFARVVGKRPFALVALAKHMPRAMEIFGAFGLHPVGCPYDFTARKMPDLVFQNWFALYNWLVPDATSLRGSQDTMHEYIGILWFRMRKAFLGIPQT